MQLQLLGKNSAIAKGSKPEHFVVEFDGGTPCNIPRLGFGIGYGSYRINGGPVVRLSHYKPMSNNAAEILTLIRALETLPFGSTVLVKGDSQITLRNIKGRKINKGATPLFQEVVSELRTVCMKFSSIETQWQPRQKSVAAFGH